MRKETLILSIKIPVIILVRSFLFHSVFEILILLILRWKYENLKVECSLMKLLNDFIILKYIVFYYKDVANPDKVKIIAINLRKHASL